MTDLVIDNLDAVGFVPELEHEILGSLMVSSSPAAFLSGIKPEYFIDPLNRRIFQEIETCVERYSYAHAVVIQKLFSGEDKEKASKYLGMTLAQYLAALSANTVYGVAGFKRSVPSLIQQYARISLGQEASRIAAISFDAATDPAEVVKSATRSFDDIATVLKGSSSGKTRFTFSESSGTAIEEIQQSMQSGGVSGITWGLDDMNRLTGGLHAGQMVVVGARPGMMKTGFALSVGIKAAKAGHGVAFISLEMNASTLSKRMLSDIAFDRGVEVPYTDMISGRITERQLEDVVEASMERDTLPFWIEDKSGLSVPDIAVTLDRMSDDAARHGKKIDLVIIDYLQLVSASSRYKGNKVAEVSEVSFALRNMVRERGMSLIVLSQLSRGVESREDKRPMLSDLRDSGAIEQDADMVMFLYRESYYLANAKPREKTAEIEADWLDKFEQCKHKLECIVAKQRNGAVRTVDVFVNVECSAIRNAARNY